MEAGWRDARGQAAQERQRVHVDRERPVGVGLLERDAQQPIVAWREVLLSDGRTQHVAQQCLAARGVLRPSPGGPMQRESIGPRHTAACRTRACGGGQGRSTTGAQPAAPDPRPPRRPDCLRHRPHRSFRRHPRRSGVARAAEDASRSAKRGAPAPRPPRWF